MKTNLFRPSSVIGLLALVISIFGVFSIKHAVRNLRSELKAVERDILRTEEDLHILKAEISYKTRPDILTKLAADNLKLVAIELKNIKHINLEDLTAVFSKETKGDDAGNK